MKTQHILIGLVVLIALGIAWFVIDPDRGALERVVAPGDPVLSFDVNTVASIHIVAGEREMRLARRDGEWVVPDVHDHPANFERLARELLRLDQLRIGQVIRGGEELLGELGLDEAADSEDRPHLTLTFDDEAGKRLGRVAFGKARTAPADEGGLSPPRPDGMYARLDDGPVVVLPETFYGFPTDTLTWLASQLAPLSEEEVVRVTSQRFGVAPLVLRRDVDGAYQMEALRSSEQVNRNAARQLFSALRHFAFIKVAGPRHGELDIDFSQVDVYEAESRDGVAYRFLVGEARPDGSRYFRVIARDVKTGEPHELNRRFDGWTYVMASNAYAIMFPERSSVVEVPPPTTSSVVTEPVAVEEE